MQKIRKLCFKQNFLILERKKCTSSKVCAQRKNSGEDEAIHNSAIDKFEAIVLILGL